MQERFPYPKILQTLHVAFCPVSVSEHQSACVPIFMSPTPISLANRKKLDLCVRAWHASLIPIKLDFAWILPAISHPPLCSYFGEIPLVGERYYRIAFNISFRFKAKGKRTMMPSFFCCSLSLSHSLCQFCCSQHAIVLFRILDFARNFRSHFSHSTSALRHSLGIWYAFLGATALSFITSVVKYMC